MVWWSEFLTTNHEDSGMIPEFAVKMFLWKRFLDSDTGLSILYHLDLRTLWYPITIYHR